MISLIILGNNSALPAHGRHPSAQVLQTPNGSILIDCGEGTQTQLVRYKIKPSKINTVIISHMHGDHYFGLIGMLTSMGLMGRTEPLHIYSPASLELIIEAQLKAANSILPFPVYFVSLELLSAAFVASGLRVQAFETDHRIPCWGFTFETMGKPRSIIKEQVDAFNIPISFYNALQNGYNYEMEDGSIISNDQLTKPIQKKKYAYCADTRYSENFLMHIMGADLLYHESTYLKEDTQKAFDRFHSTSEQAANLAKKASAKKLLLGHFSSKYIELEPFREEALCIFPNTEIATEGCCFII